ncbi:MAG: hypothetical protein CSH36_01920 [Thalassolituus sp.]|nr:MAG: hypothetical protein CSH36_01920 [Thalassolituus sp.]
MQEAITEDADWAPVIDTFNSFLNTTLISGLTDVCEVHL